MEDDFNSAPGVPERRASTPSAQPGAAFDIAEEFGTPSKTLPPTAIVLAGIVLIGAIVGALGGRSVPAPPQPDRSMMWL